MKHNPFVWIEIPVNDMARAVAFYEKVFEFKIQLVDFGGLKMGWFPNAGDAPGATGTLIQQESYIPSQEGPLVYFYSENLQNELDRVEDAGGKILHPKTQISEDHGYMGVFEDSEGNRVALHSNA
ncbi:VOC family protein [Aureisphaera galaxeae]|uniref:VOC family protein n=1 Tax=Aureisphaera galaxeae TaxID=1538023 RepID=UPI00235002A9|nr:VOC family protein [Aureisphaera galaxeae]MDC8003704.1 VOC family protein [Aureisphaera galaxeae]